MAKIGYTPTPSSESSLRNAVRFQGFICSHHSHIDSAQGSFPWAKLSSCSILAGFDICYTLFGFVCSNHNTIIHPHHLIRHLKGKHRRPGKQFTTAETVVLQDHVFSAHGISNETIEFPLPTTPLQEDIPGLIPYLAFACPIQGCTAFLQSNTPGENRLSSRSFQRNVWDHVERHHDKKLIPDLKKTTIFKGRYVIKPFKHSLAGTDQDWNLTLPYAEDYHPGLTSQQPCIMANINTSQPPAPVSADWLNELGWHTWIERTGADTEALRTLVHMPQELGLKSFLPRKNPRHTLEVGILAIHRLLDCYLRDANEFVDEKHGDLRTKVTAG